jgi:hypothetical protein
VVVFRTLAATQRRLLRSRRPKRVEPGQLEPEPVPTSRVTVIQADGFDDETAAKSWLEACRAREQARDEAIEAGMRVLNRAVQAQRVAAANPYIGEVSREQAVAIKLGYGSGEEVVDGRWHDACVVPPRSHREGRRQMLAPVEQVAAILGGRQPVYPSEDLMLRARLDLENGRERQAALQLRATLDALEAEIDGQEGGFAQGEARNVLSERRAAVESLCRAALRSELRDDELSELEDALQAVERSLRRRRHASPPAGER